MIKQACLALVLALLAAPAFAQDADSSLIRVTASLVHLNPEDVTQKTVGVLTYLGGLWLHSEDERFGGFSGLELDALEPQALSGGIISDVGMAGEIVIGLNDDGGPQSVLLRGHAFVDDKGDPLDKYHGDSEGLAGQDGVIAVSFERDHRIEYFHPASGVGAAGPKPNGLDPLDGNNGIEALAFLPDGQLLAGAESISKLRGYHPVWRFTDPRDQSEAAFEIAAAGPGYGLVGMDATPRGNLVILERFYLPGLGNRTAISWIDAATAATATGHVDARRLATLEPPLTLDNFEGIAATAREDGSTALWLVSDDNFSRDQRTLLLGFSFDEAAIEREEGGG